MQEEQSGEKGRDKEFTIIVNARKKTWNEKKISFRQVVVLAFGAYDDNPDVSYTVTYSKGPEPNPEGRLVDGRSVIVKDGMVFNVKRTNKS
jgi:hypothetical protein